MHNVFCLSESAGAVCKGVVHSFIISAITCILLSRMGDRVSSQFRFMHETFTTICIGTNECLDSSVLDPVARQLTGELKSLIARVTLKGFSLWV